MPTVPIPRFNDMDMNDPEDLLTRLTRLSRSLEYIMNHLDHANVRQLFTEYVNIQSKDGETEIDGPTLVMKAANSTTIRLKMGWVPASSNFAFELYNNSGVKTISINSSGDAVFTGTVTGSTIIGGTIKTAETGQRIEMTDNNFFMYNSSNQLEGLVFGSTFGVWGDVFIYDDGIKKAEFYQDIDSVTFRPATTDMTVGIGKAGAYTWINGYMRHSGSKLSFFNKDPITQLAITQTASTVADTIRDKLNELINGLHQYGLFSS